MRYWTAQRTPSRAPVRCRAPGLAEEDLVQEQKDQRGDRNKGEKEVAACVESHVSAEGVDDSPDERCRPPARPAPEHQAHREGRRDQRKPEEKVPGDDRAEDRRDGREHDAEREEGAIDAEVVADRIVLPVGEEQAVAVGKRILRPTEPPDLGDLICLPTPGHDARTEGGAEAEQPEGHEGVERKADRGRPSAGPDALCASVATVRRGARIGRVLEPGRIARFDDDLLGCPAHTPPTVWWLATLPATEIENTGTCIPVPSDRIGEV